MPEEVLIESVAANKLANEAIQEAHRRMVIAIWLLATLLTAVIVLAAAGSALLFTQQQKGQERASKAIAEVNEVTVSVGECVKDPDVRDVRSCVSTVLEEASP